jgi:hypothetical protein
MKKITLSLLTAGCLFTSMRSQTNFTIEAPQNNSTTSEFRAPNGSSIHAFQRTVMFISASELAPMTLSSINSFSFQYVKGTGSIPVAGNFTVYMQNTNDAGYAKGTDFPTAVAPMQMVYNSTYTVPASVGAATVGVTLSSAFNYTGGGLYVAYDWDSAGPFAVAGATYACNNTQTACATADAAAPGPVGNTLGMSAFRPALIFDAVNTASNEITVMDIQTDGKIAKLFNAPQVITANIQNLGLNAQTNVSVALNVGGANSFSDTQVIANLAIGATETVTFAPFTSANSGINTVSVTTLLTDDVLSNNKRVWTQSVTCTDQGSLPPVANSAFLTTNAYGLGGSGAGFIYSTKFTPAANVDLKGVNIFLANFAQYNVGKPLQATLMDNVGTILAQGTAANTTGSMLSKWNVFKFDVPEALTANTEYYIGVALTTNSFYPMAILNNTYTTAGFFTSPGFYNSPITGGSFNQMPVDYLGIEAVLSFSNMEISASASKTIVCKTDGPDTVTLTAVSGLSTFTWTANGNALSGSGSSIVTTPTVSSTQGGQILYNVVGTDAASGCKSTNATITISVSACTALSSLSSNGYDVKVFPNPAANGKSTITGLVGTNKVTVYNTLGQVVITQIVTEDTVKLDLSNQPSGNYMVKISDSTNESRLIKLINQN